jgi:tellurite resistance protein TehA-like permease
MVYSKDLHAREKLWEMAQEGSNGRSLENLHTEHGNSNGTGKASSENEEPKHLSYSKWIEERFTWSWFTCTQSTGGVAVVLSECPKQFAGLQTIGTIIFIFNLVLFLIFNGLLITRWTLNPSKIRTCFTTAPECFFYGSWWLSIATIIMCMQRYGVPHSGPWLITAIRICFWLYAACTLLSTTIMFVVMGKHTKGSNLGSNPGILLTVFHAMLTGTVAAAIAADQPPYQRVPIMVAGVGFQGYGWIMSVIYMAHIICVLLEKGWPAVNVRPGLFMMVRPYKILT